MIRNKRQLQKEETREKIIKTAMQVYAKEGFATPTSVIAKKAGISHGSVFNHFSTLEELLLCLLDKFAQTVILKLHNLSLRSDSIEEVLFKYLEVIKEYEDFYKRLISETNILPNEVRYTLLGIQSGIAHHLLKIIEKQIDDIKEISLHMLFNTWLALVHYYLQNSYLFVSDGESVIACYQEELVKTYITLIRRKG